MIQEILKDFPKNKEEIGDFLSQNYINILNKAYKLTEEAEKINIKKQKQLEKQEKQEKQIQDDQAEALRQAGLALLLIFLGFIFFPFFIVLAAVKNMK